MVRVATILGLVLANLLLINCYPTVNVEKSSNNGVLHNTDATDEGSNTQKNIIQSLTHLGDFNGKGWFIGRTPVNYAQALYNCEYYGLSVASANQEELNFLSSVTDQRDDFAWLGAFVPWSLDSFRWNWNGSTPSHIPLYLDSTLPSFGLVLDRYGWNAGGWNSGLRVELTTVNRFYICAAYLFTEEK